LSRTVYTVAYGHVSDSIAGDSDTVPAS
jgi:hypothetical protein